MNGIVNVYKEKGYTSHDVIAILRGILQTKKMGHTGTLDPDAEGVLPVCVGKATKVADDIMGASKKYIATLVWGSETTTQDASGEVVKTYEYEYNEEDVLPACESFIGTYEQVPPMYSALKVDGMKLYEMARLGMEVERKARPITIFDIQLLETTPEFARIEVHCSKGTYIRTLCEDIGRKLGYGAHMKKLLRTATGDFELKDSKKLDEIRELMRQERYEEFMSPLESFFKEYAKWQVIEEEDRYLHNGNPLTYPQSELPVKVEEPVRMYNSKGEFVGLYKVKSVTEGKVHMVAYKMFAV